MFKRNNQRGFIGAILMIIIGVVIFSYVKNIPIVKFFWNSFTDNMTRMHNGQLNDWQLAAPITVFNTPH